MTGTVYFGEAVLLYYTEVAGYVYSEPGMLPIVY